MQKRTGKAQQWSVKIFEAMMEGQTELEYDIIFPRPLTLCQFIQKGDWGQRSDGSIRGFEKK
jgi:hypothetical protein